MSRATILRRQAETCLQLSYTCSDPSTADHLRMIAAEYFETASDLEHDHPSLIERGLNLLAGSPAGESARRHV
jgi:hypothetical protein